MAWATALRKADYPVSQGEVVVLPPSRSLNTWTAPKLAQKLSCAARVRAFRAALALSAGLSPAVDSPLRNSGR